MPNVVDSSDSGWEAFVEWAEAKEISFQRKAHWGPWWECWKATLKSCKEMPNVLTCVYCGEAYPEGTPPSQTKVLTDHIKVCPKHPMRIAENCIVKTRQAIEGLAMAFREVSIHMTVLKGALEEYDDDN